MQLILIFSRFFPENLENEKNEEKWEIIGKLVKRTHLGKYWQTSTQFGCVQSSIKMEFLVSV